jgi:hypothetical protein
MERSADDCLPRDRELLRPVPFPEQGVRVMGQADPSPAKVLRRWRGHLTVATRNNPLSATRASLSYRPAAGRSFLPQFTSVHGTDTSSGNSRTSRAFVDRSTLT